MTGVDSVAERRVGTLSLGMKQRLGIALALALLGDPPVLMFDEPVNGLHPEGVHWLRQLLKTLAAEGRTVLVSSHLMSEMALTAEQLAALKRRLAAHGAAVTAEDDQRLAVAGMDAPVIADLATAQAIAVHELTPRHATLEQAYLDLTNTSVDYRARTPADEQTAG